MLRCWWIDGILVGTADRVLLCGKVVDGYDCILQRGCAEGLSAEVSALSPSIGDILL